MMLQLSLPPPTKFQVVLKQEHNVVQVLRYLNCEANRKIAHIKLFFSLHLTEYLGPSGCKVLLEQIKFM